MIFLDTNYFVRLLVDPQNPDDVRKADSAARLMRSAASGSLKVTTSEAVIAEAVFVLSGRLYKVSRVDVASKLGRLIMLPGFSHPHSRLWVTAFDIWLDRHALSFVDALAAAHALAYGHDLATFDKDLSRYPGLALFAN